MKKALEVGTLFKLVKTYGVVKHNIELAIIIGTSNAIGSTGTIIVYEYKILKRTNSKGTTKYFNSFHQSSWFYNNIEVIPSNTMATKALYLDNKD